MSEFLQLTISGATIGIIYAAIAVGYASIYAATGIINFTLGAQAMMCGYVAYVWLGNAPLAVALIAAVVVGAVSSWALWRLVFSRIYAREGAMPTVIASFAASIAVQELVRIVSSADVRRAESPFGDGTLRAAGVAISHHSIGSAIVGGLLLTAVALGFRTRWALAAKAVFQDPMMARAIGVPSTRVTDVIFVVSGAATAVAGLMLAPLTGISPFTGVYVALIGFVGAVVGGIASVGAAAAGAVLLGIVQSLFAGYASASYTNALIFGLLALVLVIRPSGVLVAPEKNRV